MAYYKATTLAGLDFHTGTVDYGAALTSGAEVRHPEYDIRDKRLIGYDAAGYLSMATVPTDCTGMAWPCRLFEVEPVGRSWTPDAALLPSKRACYSLRVVRELPATDAMGPQGAQLASLIGQAAALTEPQARELAPARDAAGYAARDAAGYAARAAARAVARAAARAAARDAAWDAAGDVAWDAAGALTVRDLIGTQPRWDQAAYDLLTGPWRKVIGPIHPEDTVL